MSADSPSSLAGELPLGTRMGEHHQIAALLGSGGMGHVYRARHLGLDRDDAIKVLKAGADPQADARLVLEAQRAARLSHPNICTVYHVGREQGRAYLVMELVHGVTLEERLRGGALPFDAARRYGLQIAEALAHAHESGVVHGDLKPANIMITPHGHLKVLDFGVARVVPGAKTPRPIQAELETVTHATDSVVTAGTLRYLPPEALRNEPVDARGDLWALGIVLFEMITGRPAFKGSNAYELATSILRDPPPPLDPATPPELQTAVRRCLEKDVGRRCQTAAAVREILECASTPATIRVPRRLWWVAAALLALVLSVAGLWLANRSSTLRDRVSIAVLPLDSLSGAGDEYFADGVTEVLIGDLAQVRALRVISRQSTVGYRGTTTPLAEIARTLGVDYLVKGTITKSGTQVRITAQLLDPSSDEHLWSDAFTRPLGDVLTLQNEVAREIARHVAVTIRPEEEGRFAQPRPVRADVADAYLKGRALWGIRSRQALSEAADAFRTAITLDPSHAQSYAGLGDTYAVQASLGFVRGDVGYPMARDSAETALRLDPGLAEPHATIGRVKFSYEWDAQAAEHAFQRALSINPGYPTARQWYSVLLATQGRMKDALDEARLAEENDPRSAIIHWNVARTHYFRGDAAAALAAIARAVELDPDFAMAHVLAARVHASQNQAEQARQALARVRPDDVSVHSRALAAFIAARSGDRSGAIEAITGLEQDTAAAHVLSYELAKVYAALNDPEQALARLRRAVDERAAQVVFMAIDPELASLRGDARFQAQAARVGVAERRR